MSIIKVDWGGAGADLEVGVEKEVGTIKIGSTTYKRYVKVVSCGALPSVAGAQGQKRVEHGITYAGILSVAGTAIQSSSLTGFSLFRTPISDANNVDIYFTSTEIVITTGSNLAAYDTTYITFEYYR